ncbi:MAG: hypothetical protein Q9191_002771 [Dirinaria sp. TL-2023a]
MAMAGIGEFATFFSLAGEAIKLSKTVYDLASKYKQARKQIESFARELQTLGDILDQYTRGLKKGLFSADPGAYSIIASIVNQCEDLFSDLEKYRDALYTGPETGRSIGFLGKTRWAFQTSELNYLQTRVDGMKINLLLMMTLQTACAQNRSVALDTPEANPNSSSGAEFERTMEERNIQAQRLSVLSNSYVQRLQQLEEQLLDPEDDASDIARKRMSITIVPTAVSTQSIRDSILSFYGRETNHRLSNRHNAGIWPDNPAHTSAASALIEDYLGLDPEGEDGARWDRTKYEREEGSIMSCWQEGAVVGLGSPPATQVWFQGLGSPVAELEGDFQFPDPSESHAVIPHNQDEDGYDAADRNECERDERAIMSRWHKSAAVIQEWFQAPPSLVELEGDLRFPDPTEPAAIMPDDPDEDESDAAALINWAQDMGLT